VTALPEKDSTSHRGNKLNNLLGSKQPNPVFKKTKLRKEDGLGVGSRDYISTSVGASLAGNTC
jgi:hypothetical protein